MTYVVWNSAIKYKRDDKVIGKRGEVYELPEKEAKRLTRTGACRIVDEAFLNRVEYRTLQIVAKSVGVPADAKHEALVESLTQELFPKPVENEDAND